MTQAAKSKRALKRRNRLPGDRMTPLMAVILFFLLGWNLPAASAMIAALAMKAFLKRQTPELPPEQLIFPKIWMIIGMSVALTAASFFLILPIK